MTEEQAIMAEAKECGISYGAKTLKELRENLEDVAGSWNGEDDQCMGTRCAGGDMISEEDAGNAQELIERIDTLLAKEPQPHVNGYSGPMTK